MQVIVKLFGPQARAVGASQVVLDCQDESPTCAAILSQLAAAEPRLGNTLTSSRLAINFEFADLDQVIAPNDEVALIGMVSGG